MILTPPGIRSLFRILVCVALPLLLVGCLGEPDLSDLRSFTENAYRDKKPEVEPLPILKPYQAFTYSATDVADPFSRDNLIDPTEARTPGSVPDAERRREPLEQFPLDALSMVGTMFRDDQSWVIVRAPDGSVHRLTVGNHLGQDNGKITRILEEQVEIREIVLGPTGVWEERMVNVVLVEG